MFFISKRKLKLLLLIAFLFIAISFAVDEIIKFQLNKEIQFYKKIFKDSNEHGFYDPINIKQIPSKTIQEIYDQKLSLSLSKENEGNDNKKVHTAINWDKYAYASYVADATYLCNTLIQFKSLLDKGTKAKLVLLISKDILDEESARNNLEKLRNFNSDQIILKEIESVVKTLEKNVWDKSLTKLLIFNETDYNRIVYFDNNAMIRDKMDELFFIPEYIDFAAPLNYWDLNEGDIEEAYNDVRIREKWPIKLSTYTQKLRKKVTKNLEIYNDLPNLPPSLFLSTDNVAKEIIKASSRGSPLSRLWGSDVDNDKLKFSTNLMVIKPNSEYYYDIVNTVIPKYLNEDEKNDVDIINEELYNLKKIIYFQFRFFKKLRSRFMPKVLILPFREYGLLSSSIRDLAHYDMIYNDVLGYYNGEIDPSGSSVMGLIEHSSKYIHFSDPQIEKPWVYSSMDEIKCQVGLFPTGPIAPESFEQDVQACSVWNELYGNFLDARDEVCY
ncbi:glucose N-acetyltransferase SCDLUD_000735 [Saccharomycodes ludwigii]|uniref:glucose N-acetyltransferase n=1 Tax=Saccharomycodes ludwigii TaxID=36035 RepID=UPI001E88DD26|nr:hypothetical protein SCDLUD_000735 [Saccharomycodes ludwigii]KAH3903123.1 hypothetical protein SCDLUD_000735 [Saccharomycodes ludwigii]